MKLSHTQRKWLPWQLLLANDITHNSLSHSHCQYRLVSLMQLLYWILCILLRCTRNCKITWCQVNMATSHFNCLRKGRSRSSSSTLLICCDITYSNSDGKFSAAASLTARASDNLVLKCPATNESSNSDGTYAYPYNSCDVMWPDHVMPLPYKLQPFYFLLIPEHDWNGPVTLVNAPNLTLQYKL